MYFGLLVCPLSEKELQFSDMNSAPLDLKTAMLERIRADAPRKVWTPSAVQARAWMLPTLVSIANMSGAFDG